MRTYLRSDYALHPCGAGYEYCDGECSHCEAAASTYTSNTTQPKYEPWRKDKSIEQKYITLPLRCEHCGALMDGRCR